MNKNVNIVSDKITAEEKNWLFNSIFQVAWDKIFW